VKRGTKRFYKTVDVNAEGEGFAVLLDGKPVKTPGGRTMSSPTLALAKGIAAEWREQGPLIDLGRMQLTKALNTALDRVAVHREDVIDELASFAGSDLLCYRAEAPEALVQRQSAVWDHWLKWAARTLGADLAVATGIVHTEQMPGPILQIRSAIAALDDFRLTALHTGVTITGSAVLGLAFLAGALTADEAFAASQVDEEFQAERWGRDAEAEGVRARRLEELRAARQYLDLLND